jgi:hypothetical protein
MTISGGNINASGSLGSAIGSGFSSGGSSRVSRLVTVNGSFSLRASSPYSGIGDGPVSPSLSSIFEFLIFEVFLRFARL